MTDVTFVGIMGDEHIANTIELGKVITAMQLVLEGEDAVFDTFINKMDKSQKALLDAMGWEQDKTIKAYLHELQNFGRFAITGMDIDFGVSSINGDDAAEAMRKGEY